jgi:4-amino-4-deoxy-L-arabinose transferase-like glycosyltransferase
MEVVGDAAWEAGARNHFGGIVPHACRPEGRAPRHFVQSRAVHPRLAQAARILAVAVLTFVAAALRADVLVARYGQIARPAWAGVATDVLAAVGERLRPVSIRWKRDPTPYVGGDPINYLRFGREMQSFYQPHVREPVFLALVRSQLWLLDDGDIAVSTASAVSSVLVVPASYLAGAAAFGPAVGLVAAAGWAVEMDSVSQSVDGWRDDTFTLFTVLTLWSLLRLRQVRSPRRAVVAGTLAGLACLTRLSALTFVLPALAWLVVEAPRGQRRSTLALTALSGVVVAIVVGPYLIACARATGDPFYAVNYHTRFYRPAEGLPVADESALGFVGRHFVDAPLRTADTVVGGLFSWPFGAKWDGFRPWSPLVAHLLEGAAALGLILMLWSGSGRLLLVVLFFSLVPYCLTWALAGGGYWRFSEHTYPLYLIAAGQCLREAWRAAATLARRPGEWRALLRPTLWIPAAGIVGIGAIVWAAYYAMPLLIARETLAHGRPAIVEALPRHRWFFAGSWSSAHPTGNIIVRAATGPHAGLRFLMPARADCVLLLRLDPILGAHADDRHVVSVFLNRRLLADLRLQYDPLRVGSYDLPVPASGTVAGWNSVELVSSDLAPASDAGPDFSWLDPRQPVAFRLWYFGVQPAESPG